MKRRIIGFLFVLTTAVVAAFVAMGQVLPNLPANTVFGRLGIGTGPGQAIPFSILVNNLMGSLNTITGDVTFSPGGVSTISANTVTNAKAAQMSANGCKGNNTGGASNVLDLTVAQCQALLG